MTEPAIAPPEPPAAVADGSASPVRVCDRCGRSFRPYRPWQRFCSGGRCRKRTWDETHPRVHLAPKPPARPKHPRPMPTAERRARLIVRLGRDGRHPLAELAAELGCSSRLIASDVRALARVLPVEREGGDVVARYLLLRLDERRPATAAPPLPGAELAHPSTCRTMASADPEVGTRCCELPASASS